MEWAGKAMDVPTREEGAENRRGNSSMFTLQEFDGYYEA